LLGKEGGVLRFLGRKGSAELFDLLLELFHVSLVFGFRLLDLLLIIVWFPISLVLKVFYLLAQILIVFALLGHLFSQHLDLPLLVRQQVLLLYLRGFLSFVLLPSFLY
jgi:hypothetical protein